MCGQHQQMYPPPEGHPATVSTIQRHVTAACRTDVQLRDTMIKVEESIDAGKLRMKPEVRAGTIVTDVRRHHQCQA
jgi:hypothetical protein